MDLKEGRAWAVQAAEVLVAARVWSSSIQAFRARQIGVTDSFKHPIVEPHYLSKRSRRQPSILTFLCCPCCDVRGPWQRRDDSIACVRRLG